MGPTTGRGPTCRGRDTAVASSGPTRPPSLSGNPHPSGWAARLLGLSLSTSFMSLIYIDILVFLLVVWPYLLIVPGPAFSGWAASIVLAYQEIMSARRCLKKLVGRCKSTVPTIDGTGTQHRYSSSFFGAPDRSLLQKLVFYNKGSCK